jgi:hypothetical protein
VRLIVLVMFSCLWAHPPRAIAATTVYSCKRDGATIHQQTPCGDDGAVRRFAEPPPAAAPARVPGDNTIYTINGKPVSSEEYERERQRFLDRQAMPSAAPTAEAAPDPDTVSYRCTNGDAVFYTHTPCDKKTIRGMSVPVTKEERISRQDACHELNRASASSRYGHDYDDRVSPYDKNAGRDPCR